MRRSQLFVGVALGIACTGIALSGSAQQKKPKHGATPASSSTAAPPAASGPAHAAPHGKPGHTPDPKPKPVVDEPKPPPPDTSPGATGHQVVERESHIEFDERMVRGQSAAGAIYLFNRSPSEFKSIVKVPDSFRPRTVALVRPRGDKP